MEYCGTGICESYDKQNYVPSEIEHFQHRRPSSCLHSLITYRARLWSSLIFTKIWNLEMKNRASYFSKLSPGKDLYHVSSILLSDANLMSPPVSRALQYNSPSQVGPQGDSVHFLHPSLGVGSLTGKHILSAATMNRDQVRLCLCKVEKSKFCSCQ